jgi:hypothetical protein
MNRHADNLTEVAHALDYLGWDLQAKLVRAARDDLRASIRMPAEQRTALLDKFYGHLEPDLEAHSDAIDKLIALLTDQQVEAFIASYPPEHWEEPVDYCLEDWQREVASGLTRVGYAEWLEGKT